MRPEDLQLGLAGFLMLLIGVFVLARRKQLSESNAKNADALPNWPARVDHSREFFLILNTVGGIVFVLIGLISIVAALFRGSDIQVSRPISYAMVATVGLIFAGGLVTIIYVNFRFRAPK